MSISMSTQADTIAKYANIAKSIPAAKLKADQKAQTWARSARSILDVTEESIAQTIQAMQQLAAKQGKPLFCLKNDADINTAQIHQILESKIQSLAAADANKTISEVVIEALASNYPCPNSNSASNISHHLDRQSSDMQRVTRN